MLKYWSNQTYINFSFGLLSKAISVCSP